jgi:hypothetical protein
MLVGAVVVRKKTKNQVACQDIDERDERETCHQNVRSIIEISGRIIFGEPDPGA